MQQAHENTQTGELNATLHPATTVGTVTLKVGNLKRSLKFYNDLIGLQTLHQAGREAAIGAGTRVILRLEEIPNAQPQPQGSTGLYHAAILFPERHSLAVKIAQITATHYPLGWADHLVSEAFYLSDPDGNGLELYRDRPRDEWGWDGKSVRMASDPIDFDSFFAEIKEGDPDLERVAAPAGTTLGHVHLRVADIPRTEWFYHGVLGFDIVAHWPGALFVSAGGYHHHLGLNTWESRGGSPAPDSSIGLREYSIVLPDHAEL
ncbi:MAG TPA: VOC family protein, partial [Aggregatilineales bacterium]|nr:VOC family protein [Aggregatilineales bacterium]